ncbi:hypothetical protein GMDG_07707 [Pseudogymnoascus destructans 20631-21]|uniref:Uncharacterized protein n=1 Tax=Pseudogymnoascus destructans (strain ATCC MYA-4855 / 20631-21) TaxID=658429 RepID=L8FZH7_PSED2|nr:hypothetical protein GMDG_07707 [Pseudogymnoascus destructans 20631-21]
MGKVHGSLARAGKVKSQTPKRFERDDFGSFDDIMDGLRREYSNRTLIFYDRSSRKRRRRPPKGRAKKRIQYTRRFVNVTLTGGKRKMNPNPTA